MKSREELEAELRELLDAEVVRMKIEHKRLMKKAMFDGVLVVFLLVILFIWMMILERMIYQRFFDL